MTRASLSDLELGRSKSPSAASLISLAETLHLDPTWLLRGDEDADADA